MGKEEGSLEGLLARGRGTHLPESRLGLGLPHGQRGRAPGRQLDRDGEGDKGQGPGAALRTPEWIQGRLKEEWKEQMGGRQAELGRMARGKHSPLPS